jgi:hypothetical protein
MTNSNNKTLDRETHQQNVGLANKIAKIFGFNELPTGLDEISAGIIQGFKGWLAAQGEEKTKKIISTALKVANIGNTEQQRFASDISGKVVGFIIPYIDTAVEFAEIAKINIDNKSALMTSLAPIAKANLEAGGSNNPADSVKRFFSSGFEGNAMVTQAAEIIANQRNELIRKSVIGAAPNALSNFSTSYLKPQIAKLSQSPDTINSEVSAIEQPNINEGNNQLKALKWLKENIDQYGNQVGGAFSKLIQNKIDTTDPMQVIEQNTSLGKVLKIQKYMQEQGIGKEGNPSITSDVRKIREMVKDTFAQFQTEQGEPVIKHRLDEVTERLASEIAFGQMEALSLVNIIGKKQLMTEGKDGYVSEERMNTVIEQELKIFSKGSTVNVKEFIEAVNFSLSDVKTHFNSSDKDERGITALLIPESVLLASGVSKKDREEALAAIEPKIFGEFVQAVITNIAQNSDKELKSFGYDKASIEFIKECRNDPENAIETSSQQKFAEKIVRKAIMAQKSETWQEILTKGVRNTDELAREFSDRVSQAKKQPALARN